MKNSFYEPTTMRCAKNGSHSPSWECGSLVKALKSPSEIQEPGWSTPWANGGVQHHHREGRQHLCFTLTTCRDGTLPRDKLNRMRDGNNIPGMINTTEQKKVKPSENGTNFPVKKMLPTLNHTKKGIKSESSKRKAKYKWRQVEHEKSGWYPGGNKSFVQFSNLKRDFAEMHWHHSAGLHRWESHNFRRGCWGSMTSSAVGDNNKKSQPLFRSLQINFLCKKM